MTVGRTAAVVLAGGDGARMGSDRPKQLLHLGGKTILERSIAAFEDIAGIDEILVMMTPDSVPVAAEIVRRAGFMKVTHVAPGGLSRRGTTLSALRLLGTDVRDVLVHDAARPLVPAAVIQRCLDALVVHEAVTPVVGSRDTVYSTATGGKKVVAVLHRDHLRLAQTPQGFRRELLQRAHELAEDDDHAESTDDCGIMRRYLPDVDVYLVDGDECNIKVTTPSDLTVAEVLHAQTKR